MQILLRYRRTIIVISALITAIFVLTQCISDKKSKEKEVAVVKTNDISQFVGSAKCATCHKDIFEKHVKTPHFLTSAPATEKTILGSFAKGTNDYAYSPDLRIEMEKNDSGFFQVIYFKGDKKMQLPFHTVIGSGAKGQTFIYWKDNKLYQLPISYYTAPAKWANSPGFPNKVQYDRPITSRCLECHVSFAATIGTTVNGQEQFDRNSILYGVDCEKCHGPGASHIDLMSHSIDTSKGMRIINPGSLTRQQNLDLCALCHGGKMDKTRPSFTFQAGDQLSNFFNSDTLTAAAISTGSIDVHGNQYGLLKASKCFTSSSLICGSCHDPHENERGKVELFSQRCGTCHKDAHDDLNILNQKTSASITSNCIDCHMPLQRSRSIALQLPGEEVPTAARIRSHLIAVYPEESKTFLDDKKKRAN